MKVITAILLSIGYWFCALTVLGFVVVIYGDCRTDMRLNGAALCFAETQKIARWGLAVAATVYAVGGMVLWRRTQRNRPLI